MTFDDARAFASSHAVRSACVASELEWNAFRKTSSGLGWVYLLRWTVDRYCWGTCSNKNDRLRKSSIFNEKLTGKYDRRVDYLMLKIIHGLAEAWVFESANPTVIEGALKDQCGQIHCYRGISGADRDGISKTILAEFKATKHYGTLICVDQENFDE